MVAVRTNSVDVVVGPAPTNPEVAGGNGSIKLRRPPSIADSLVAAGENHDPKSAAG